ncbi:MAG: 3,4-dihydroxyphenylacetate 2,3-dioxygenase [Xanthobacteraceae bacterium]
MPLRDPVLYPPFNVVRVSHVEYGATDLEHSKAWWVDTLGFVLTEQTADALYLRGLEERNHHSVVLRKSAHPHAASLGFKVYSEADLDIAFRHFSGLGLSPRWTREPFQGRTLAVRDPVGTPLEFYFEMVQVESRLRRYGEYKGARIQRIDHVNCFSPDIQRSHDFYNAMGFRTSEYTAAEGTDDLWAVWMHRKGNVHDMALTNGRGPRLHHVGVWVPGALDIIHVCDLLATTGWLHSMERGPGRHGISNAFFLYLRDPDGHRIELFNSDYLTCDPDLAPLRWDLRDARRQTLWGAPAPKSWFEEGSLFPGVALADSVFTSGEPIVAP